MNDNQFTKQRELIEKIPFFMGFQDIDKDELGDYYPEFFAIKQNCKFNNCIHKNEPKCAVKEALENDEIAASRYRSYVKIIEGDDQHYRTDIWDKE